MTESYLKSPTVVDLIIRWNVFIFFLWFLMIFVDPIFMEKHFLLSWTAVSEGRFWTLLTSVFSHNLFFHLLINMYFFYGFGKALEGILGSKRFLRLYLLSGFSGSIGHCLVSFFILNRPDLMALGASGAIAGVIIFFGLMFPKEKVYFFGLIPLPAMWAVLIFIVFELRGLFAQAQGSMAPIGYEAHLGGALGGFFYYLRYRTTFRVFSER
jgi:membrane associated rhomboid family serine protease